MDKDQKHFYQANTFIADENGPTDSCSNPDSFFGLVSLF